MWPKKETLASRLSDIAKYSIKSKLIYPVQWVTNQAITKNNELVNHSYRETYYSKMIGSIEDHAKNGGLSISFIFHEALNSRDYEETLDAFRIAGFTAYEPEYIGHQRFKRMYVSWGRHWGRYAPKRHYQSKKPFLSS